MRAGRFALGDHRTHLGGQTRRGVRGDHGGRKTLSLESRRRGDLGEVDHVGYDDLTHARRDHQLNDRARLDLARRCGQGTHDESRRDGVRARRARRAAHFQLLLDQHRGRFHLSLTRDRRQRERGSRRKNGERHLVARPRIRECRRRLHEHCVRNCIRRWGCRVRRHVVESFARQDALSTREHHARNVRHGHWSRRNTNRNLQRDDFTLGDLLAGSRVGGDDRALGFV